jgi:hypothetical protein
MSGKGQLSLDFLVIWAVMLLLFSALFAVYFAKTRDWGEIRLRKSAETLASDFTRNANFVHLAGPGASARIWLPPSLSSSLNYTLKVIGRRAEVNWTGYNQTISLPLFFSGFNGTGVTTLASGKWTNLTNRGGVVYVGQD